MIRTHYDCCIIAMYSLHCAANPIELFSPQTVAFMRYMGYDLSDKLCHLFRHQLFAHQIPDFTKFSLIKQKSLKCLEDTIGYSFENKVFHFYSYNIICIYSSGLQYLSFFCLVLRSTSYASTILNSI